MDKASHQAGAAAELAATRKEDKYVDLGAHYIFEPIAIETLGVFNASACQLLADLGRRISINTDDARDQLFVSEDFCFGAALQCCFVARQFAGCGLHGLTIVPTFVLHS